MRSRRKRILVLYKTYSKFRGRTEGRAGGQQGGSGRNKCGKKEGKGAKNGQWCVGRLLVIMFV